MFKIKRKIISSYSLKKKYEKHVITIIFTYILC